MSSTPFFATAATAKLSEETHVVGVKRGAIREHGVESLRSQLQELEATKKGQFIPLGDIRDVVMDHVLEMMESDLKYTILLVCEEVPDFRCEPLVADSTESLQSDALPPFLANVADGYKLYTKIGEGDSIPRSDSILLRIPVSKRDIENGKKSVKKSIKKQIKKFKKAHTGETSLTAEFYVMPQDTLRTHLAPIPIENCESEGYLVTKPLAEGMTRPPEQLLLAIDCEMCKTTKGVELARLTVVDSTEKVLIDEFVRCKNPIVDYCTEYSGITQEIMDECMTTLDEIQHRFLDVVPAEAILVGHSIENDLQALRVVHKRIIDTTVLYPHPRGPPFRSALRFLASTYLNRAIQTGKDGHCSVEDAVATLQLVHLKVKRGPTFPSIEPEYTQRKVISELSTAKKSVLIADSLRACRSLAAGSACTLPRDDNSEVISSVIHQLTTGFPPHFTWARVRNASRPDLASFVARLREKLPAKSCLMVVASGDTSALRELHKVRTTRSDPRSSLMWDKAQQLKLELLASRTQEGIVHVFVQ